MSQPEFEAAVKTLYPAATPGRMYWCFTMGFNPEYSAAWCRLQVEGHQVDPHTAAGRRVQSVRRRQVKTWINQPS